VSDSGARGLRAAANQIVVGESGSLRPAPNRRAQGVGSRFAASRSQFRGQIIK